MPVAAIRVSALFVRTLAFRTAGRRFGRSGMGSLPWVPDACRYDDAGAGEAAHPRHLRGVHRSPWHIMAHGRIGGYAPVDSAKSQRELKRL